MAGVDIPMSKAMRGITLVATVSGIRRARVRLWVGVRIMKLAASVVGCTINVDVTPVTPPTPQG